MAILETKKLNLINFMTFNDNDNILMSDGVFLNQCRRLGIYYTNLSIPNLNMNVELPPSEFSVMDFHLSPELVFTAIEVNTSTAEVRVRNFNIVTKDQKLLDIADLTYNNVLKDFSINDGYIFVKYEGTSSDIHNEDSNVKKVIVNVYDTSFDLVAYKLYDIGTEVNVENLRLYSDTKDLVEFKEIVDVTSLIPQGSQVEFETKIQVLDSYGEISNFLTAVTIDDSNIKLSVIKFDVKDGEITESKAIKIQTASMGDRYDTLTKVHNGNIYTCTLLPNNQYNINKFNLF